MGRSRIAATIALALALLAPAAAVAGLDGDPAQGLGGEHVLTSSQQRQNARDAAVHNVLRSRQAQNEPDVGRMTRLFAPFTARASLAATVRTHSRALRSLGKAWVPITHGWIVVQRWELTRLDGTTAVVRFIGYESFVRGKFGRLVTPLKRYRVTLHWESRWKTESQTERYLTPAGGLGEAGDTVHAPGDLKHRYQLRHP